MGKRPERARADISEQLMDAFESSAREFAKVSEGGMDMLISPRQREYLRGLLAQQSGPEAEGLLDLLEGETEPLAPVIPLVARDKDAGQEADPTTFGFWYGEQRAE